MNEKMNTALIINQGALRAEIEAWARGQSSLDAALARADFEAAVLEAVRGSAEWQNHTNSELCSALGHCTLASRVEDFV